MLSALQSAVDLPSADLHAVCIVQHATSAIGDVLCEASSMEMAFRVKSSFLLNPMGAKEHTLHILLLK